MILSIIGLVLFSFAVVVLNEGFKEMGESMEILKDAHKTLHDVTKIREETQKLIDEWKQK